MPTSNAVKCLHPLETSYQAESKMVFAFTLLDKRDIDTYTCFWHHSECQSVWQKIRFQFMYEIEGQCLSNHRSPGASTAWTSSERSVFGLIAIFDRKSHGSVILDRHWTSSWVKNSVSCYISYIQIQNNWILYSKCTCPCHDMASTKPVEPCKSFPMLFSCKFVNGI